MTRSTAHRKSSIAPSEKQPQPLSMPGAKDDQLDALVLADSLRNDGHLFRRLELPSALVVKLRQLSRLHDELQEERNGLANRCRQQLRRNFTALLKLGEVTEH